VKRADGAEFSLAARASVQATIGTRHRPGESAQCRGTVSRREDKHADTRREQYPHLETCDVKMHLSVLVRETTAAGNGDLAAPSARPALS
jgi:hypothetical protein